jgi:hypothetical protein
MKFFSLLFVFLFTFSFCQGSFEIKNPKKTVIPFQLINNLIFIPVNINGVDLTFLLDSGVKETILFSLDSKEVNFNDVEKTTFSGLGGTGKIEGLSSENNTLRIGKDYTDNNHTIFIILDESINFSSHVGIPVNGIIGYHFFKDHQVEINYVTKKITVYNDEKTFKKRQKKFIVFPITVEISKPYIMADVEINSKKVSSKMLLDLGNSDAVWLFPKLIENFEYNRPNIDDYLGRGFNGDIYGKRSRIHEINIGNFAFKKPLTAMPDEYSIQSLKLVPDRKGSIGNDILRRFTIIFDYPGNRVYLRKNTHFNDPFLFNSSGLDVQHNGMEWQKDVVKVETQKFGSTEGIPVIERTEGFRYNFVLKPKFSVAGCRPDSPCYVAGIRKNDQLISINNKKVCDLTLEKINSIFKDEDGTKVNLEIEREGQKMNFTIILVDPIPYHE